MFCVNMLISPPLPLTVPPTAEDVAESTTDN